MDTDIMYTNNYARWRESNFAPIVLHIKRSKQWFYRRQIEDRGRIVSDRIAVWYTLKMYFNKAKKAAIGRG